MQQYTNFSIMLIALWIFIAFVIFSIIILIHEWGHFSAARRFGVKVEEFWLGIPPKAKKLFTDKHGTQYTLNWLPIGWFVRLKWENTPHFHLYDSKQHLLSPWALQEALKKQNPIFDTTGEEISAEVRKEIKKQIESVNASDALQSKPAWQQSIVMLAGVAMNFVLAVFIFWILFMVGVKPVGINTILPVDTTMRLIPSVEDAKKQGLLIEKDGIYMIPIEDSIAQKAGILENDLVTHVQDIPIQTIEELQAVFLQYASENIQLQVQRALSGCDVSNPANTCTMQSIPIAVTPNAEGKIGAYIFPNIIVDENHKIRVWPVVALGYALQETYGQITLTLKWLKTIVGKIILPETPTERQEALDQVSGPIGMVNFMTKSLWNGAVFLIIIGAIISINLGVFNLLPIPALDGGRFLFIMINTTVKKIFGKKIVSDHIEWLIHVGFFLFLIILSVLIAYNDIYKIVSW